MGILYYYIFLVLGFLISWIYIQDRLEIKEKLLIVGCGQLGFKIGNALSKNFDVTGIKRIGRAHYRRSTVQNLRA